MVGTRGGFMSTGASQTGGGVAEALGDLALFGEGPETLLVTERAAVTVEAAAAGPSKSRCQIEAEAAEAEEGDGHVMRAPIFLWRLYNSPSHLGQSPEV